MTDFEPERPFLALAKAWRGPVEELHTRDLGGGYWRRLRDLDGPIPHVHTCPTCRKKFPCEKTEPTCEPFCRGYEQPDGTPHGTWIYCSQECYPKPIAPNVYPYTSYTITNWVPYTATTSVNYLNVTWVTI